MVVIGLVGNIGSGKSLAAHCLGEKGAAIVDADQISREIVLPHQPAWQKIAESFGQAYFLPDGNINRRKLGEKVFNDNASRLLLNAITHPYIYEEAKKRIQDFQSQKINMIVLEAAILLESELRDLVDEVWLVTAPKQIIVGRVQERDSLNAKEIESRLSSQTPPEQQVKFANQVILNEQTVEDLRQTMYTLYEQYQDK